MPGMNSGVKSLFGPATTKVQLPYGNLTTSVFTAPHGARAHTPQPRNNQVQRCLVGRLGALSLCMHVRYCTPWTVPAALLSVEAVCTDEGSHVAPPPGIISCGEIQQEILRQFLDPR